jgi:phage-related protein
MAAVWGRAEIIVDADGSGLPAQTRAIGEKAGASGGDSMAKSWDKSFTDGMKKALSGFSRSLKTWNKNIADSDQNIGKFRRSIQAFGKTLGNTTPMIRFRLGIDGIAKSIKGMTREMEGSGRAIEHHEGLWKSLSHNTRQWTLIIGSVLAGMEGLAVLGSAAGAGITALGSALVSAGIGAGVLITVFSNFAGEIENLPEAVRPAAREFQKLGKIFSDLRDEMQVDALADTGDAWKSLGETIKALAPAFKPLTKAINGLVKDMAKNLEPGSRAFEALFKLIEGAAPIFDRLVRVAGNLGVYLMEAFIGVTPLVEDLLGWLEKVVGAFGDFTSDAEAMSRWVANAQQVFGALGGLLESLAGMFSNLVDQAAVDRLTDFIDNISGFVDGGLTDLLNVLGELDIFGVIAEALNTFGDALAPLAGPMEDLAGAINDVLQSGIDTLGPIIEGVAEALGPLVQNIADFMAEDPEGVANGFLLIAGGVAAVKGVGLAKTAADFLLFSNAIGTGGKNVRAFDVRKLGAIAAGVGLVGALAAGAATQEGELKMGFEALLGGALTGAMAGIVFGPVGIALGALIGTAFAANSSPEIQKFEDTVNNWINEAMANIGTTFQSQIGVLGEGITNAWTLISDTFISQIGVLGEGISTAWTSVTTAFETGWNAVVNFFTVMVPQFFASVGQWFADGWTLVTMTFDSYIGQPIQAAWEGFVNFFTVSIPQFFTNMVAGFVVGWNNIVRTFTAFGATVASVWNSVWMNLIAIVTSVWSNIVNTVRSWTNNILNAISAFGATLAGIWNGIWMGLVGTVSGIWANIVNTVRGAVNTVTGIINGLTSKINGVLGLIGKLSGGLINLKIPSLPGMASGGVLMGPRRILAGEAGPEAVVPLNRPLSMVNPSVRGLSAVAQGKAPSGGTDRPTRILNVNEGAIQILGDRDPARTSLSVVNRLVERAV